MAQAPMIARLSVTDSMILDCYILGAAPARIVAAELKKPIQYIYYRGSVLARRLGIERARAREPIIVRRRTWCDQERKEESRQPPSGERVDWNLVRELKDEGASAGEIAAFLNAAVGTIKRGLSQGKGRPY